MTMQEDAKFAPFFLNVVARNELNDFTNHAGIDSIILRNSDPNGNINE